MKNQWLLASSLLLVTVVPAVQAEQTEGCMEVSVGGYKAPDYGCLSQQMGSNANGAAAEQHNQAAMDAAVTRKAPNQKGLATPAATSVRMGNTFGTSVKPQRPPVNGATAP
jgi:hypothetical protein